MMNMQHPALREAKDFIRALHGDLRSFNKTLRQDDESALARETVASALYDALVELLAGHAPQPEQPGRPIANMVPQQPAAAPQAAPENQSQAAALLEQMR
jgi:hypothetical protein